MSLSLTLRLMLVMGHYGNSDENLSICESEFESEFESESESEVDVGYGALWE